MAKPELGTKRVCPNCGAKYYDLGRDPIICPSCGASFATGLVALRSTAAADDELDDNAPAVELVGLDEAESADDDVDAAEDVEEVDAELDADDDAFIEDDDEDIPSVVGDVDEEGEEDR